jgi:hypothetical protein
MKHCMEGDVELQYVGMKLGKENYWDLNWCRSWLIR